MLINSPFWYFGWVDFVASNFLFFKKRLMSALPCSFWQGCIVFYLCTLHLNSIFVVVVQSLSCLTLCNPMDFSTPGVPVLHYLPEFVHWVSDAIYSSDGKESICNEKDMGLIPGFRRSPEEGNGDPLQYSCLENPMDRGAWLAKVHGLQRVGRDWVTKHTCECIKLSKKKYLG